MSSLERRADSALGNHNDAEENRAKKPRHRNLQPVDITNLEYSSIPSPGYAVEPILPLRVPTLLGAHGGAGKSVLGLTVAAHYAVGQAWAGLVTGRGPALFVSLEDAGNLVRWRLRKVCKACGLDMDEVAKGLTILDGTEGESALVGEINELGIRRIASTSTWTELTVAAKGMGLIVIDNASDAYAGNENDRRQVRDFMRMLGQIARDNDAAVLLLAHIDKNAARFGANGNSYSGSTGWHNSARSRLALVHSQDGIELVHEKANLSKPAPPIALSWHGLGVLVPDTARKSGAIDELEANLNVESEIVAVLAAAEAAGVTVPTGRTGPGNTLAVLTTLPELPRWARGKGGREQFWAVLARLQSKGRVERVEFWQSRRRKERFALRQTGIDSIACLSPTPPADETRETRDGVSGFSGSEKER